ncbi:hypothetical protein CBR_g23078 [Chara braunii]|uniref:CCHC-type domain-containing protein n=1 Tax=Chara braunii TaxID=69332 RepID=A0A388L3T2_CHABU|nr:hypothetical protein CBR_g23078 [Chara braunii]|eukprot:GBG76863.1 hypothetical protein CBR_g23078 [Chara braunii]
MGDRGYRTYGGEARGDQYARGRDHKRDESRDRQRGRSRDDYHEGSDRGHGGSEYVRRGPPVCFECGEAGYYKNQCWKRSEVVPAKGGASSSGVQLPEPHVVETVKKRLEDFNKSMANFQEYIAIENTKREAKECRNREKAERLQREEAERQAKEEARMAKEKRMAKKFAKKKKEEEEELEFSKAMWLHMAVCVGGLKEKMQYEMKKNMEAFQAIIKGKQQATSPSPSPSISPQSYASDWAASEVEKINQKAKELTINEKRKWSPDKTIGNSPPMELPPKRTPRKTIVKPVKLTAILQAATTKKTAAKKNKQAEENHGSPKRYH